MRCDRNKDRIDIFANVLELLWNKINKRENMLDKLSKIS